MKNKNEEMKMLCRTVFAVMLVFAFVQNVSTADENPHKKALALFKDRNYKDALGIFQRLATENQNIEDAVEDCNRSVDCLNNLARTNEFDAFAEKVAKDRANSWKMLKTVAESFMNIQHNGFIVAGKFERGQHRGGGELAQSFDRDRVRALQLFMQAIPVAEKEGDSAAKYGFYLSFANAVMQNQGKWKLQYLTDITTLPDYEKVYYGYRGSQGAPVAESGAPILYSCPANFADSKNDGERWRWLLKAAKDSNPEKASAIDLIFADFLWSQFDVQTLASSSYFGGGGGDSSFTGAIKLLSSLSEDETLAKFATGIKRYSLPREFNYIKMYQKVSLINSPDGETALNKLAGIFSNRMQYVKAAQIWDESIKRFGTGDRDYKKKALSQIVGNWGVFESIKPQSYKRDGDLFFKFRNATEASFEARKIDTAKFLDDLKSYLKSKPSQLDWNKTNVQNIGMQVLYDSGDKYFMGSKIEWNEKLEPAADHFDKTVKLNAPIKEPGAYFIISKLKDGNISRIVLWIADTAIVLKNGTYFVCDAQSGEPIKNAPLNFFGYKMDNKYNAKKPSIEYAFDEFKAATDENGFYNFNKVRLLDSWKKRLYGFQSPDDAGASIL